ncbi:hypothetical protein KAH94_06170 [bacterium]|nr:hypothetical protein [bacterium]
MDIRLKMFIQACTACCAWYAAAKYFPLDIRKASKKGYYMQVLSNYCMRSKILFNQKQKPKKELLYFLRALGIEHDGTLSGMVQSTQKAWLRPDGKERWEISDNNEKKREKILGLLKNISCVDELLPSQDFYNYAVILGALAPRVRSRLAYLFKQWEKGIRFETLVFLGGARPLHPTFESEAILCNTHNKELPFSDTWKLKGDMPSTEAEMIRMIFDQVELPKGFERVSIIFINTQMQEQQDGSLSRPNTADTVEQWMNGGPKEGSCLVVSNQPYIGYQDSVVRTFLPDSFEVETVGSAADKDLPIAVYLDTVARWLYQEQRRVNTKR